MTIIAGPTREPARTRAEDVLSRLRADILTCRLKPGVPLKFELLKETYGASFSTLREGLTALVAEGLVSSEGQRGFRVAPVSRADLLDLTDARVLIERELLRLAIENGGDDWEVATAAALHRMSLLEQRHTTRSYILTPEWQAAHAAFHAALVAPCGSPILLGVRASLYARAERYRSLSAIYRKVKRNKTEEHKAIMQAAVARKTDKALSLIDSHIRSTTANVLQFAAEMLEATQ